MLHFDIDLDKLIEVDTERRKLLTDIEEMRSKQNEASKTIAQASDSEKQGLLKEMSTLKEELQTKEKVLEPIQREWEVLMLQAIFVLPVTAAPLGRLVQ